jgi:hypothetical protein
VKTWGRLLGVANIPEYEFKRLKSNSTTLKHRGLQNKNMIA